MNAQGFLDVADELAGGAQEGHWRSAVSRAYYAAFHAARSLLVSCGFSVPRTEKAHRYLRLRLSNSGHTDLAQVGIWLNDLRSIRNQADYDIDRPFEHHDAIDQCQRAADILRLLEEAAALPTVRTRITQAIRDYERDVLQDVTWTDPGSTAGS